MKKHSQFNEGLNSFNNVIFTLKRKKIKNLIIKLNTTNEIIVSIPLNVDDQTIINFLSQNIEKFDKIKKERNEKKSINTKENWFFLFGEKRNFLIDKNRKKIIIGNKKVSFLNKTIEEAINNFRKKELKVYLLINQLKFQKIMKIEDHLIKVRNKTSAWATNHVLKKIIYYATNLSSFDTPIIDYVIIHELAHNKFANHSKNFWNFVANFDPNFKIKRYKLKKNIYR